MRRCRDNPATTSDRMDQQCFQRDVACLRASRTVESGPFQLWSDAYQRVPGLCRYVFLQALHKCYAHHGCQIVESLKITRISHVRYTTVEAPCICVSGWNVSASAPTCQSMLSCGGRHATSDDHASRYCAPYNLKLLLRRLLDRGTPPYS